MPMTRRKVKLIAVVVSLVIIAILVLQNTGPVETHILFASVSMPQAVLLVVTGGIGFAAGVLVASFRKPKQKE